MKTRIKKFTSVFLSILMAVSLFPFGAFAETAAAEIETTEEYTVYRYQDEICAFTLESWTSGDEKTITAEYGGTELKYYFAVQDSVGNICMDELSATGENITAEWVYSDDEKIGAVATITAAGEATLEILNGGTSMTTIGFSVTEPVEIVVNGNCGETVTYSLDSNGTLTISGTGAMTDYESASDTPWYSKNYNVKKIIVENGVTSIGNYAFTGTYAQSVSIAEAVATIGYAAFKETLLTEVEVPDSVTIISDFAFANCESLVTANLSENITSIYPSTFVGCTMLESITVPVGVTSIGSNAFSGCTALKTVSIPETVTKIDSGAFFYCEADVYYGYTKSGWAAIEGADSASLDGCTIHCTLFEIIFTVPENGTVAVDKMAAQAGETVTVTATPAEGYELSAILVDGTAIEGNTFTVTSDHTITATFAEIVRYSITVGPVFNGTVTVDKESAQEDETVTVTATPDEGYELQGIYVNGFVITGNTFTPYAESTVIALFKETATGLVVVDTGSCGETATWTVYDTDADGKGDHVVISGSGDMSSGVPAKAYLDTIKTVVVEEGITSIGSGAFSSHKYITQVTLPETVVSIGEQAFYKCLSLTTINFPAGLTSVGNQAFHTCKLTEFPENLESVGDYAFYGCKFTELTIPESLTTIGEYVFENCTELTTVTIPDSFTTLGYGMFSCCSKLVNITLPGKLTAVPGALFNRCTKLTEMTIPEGATSIGASAFSMCSSLASVTIPESVTTIEAYAFDSCSVLENVYYGGSPSGWSAVSIGDANNKLRNTTINYAKEDVVTYTITVEQAENGTVTVDKETATAGETVTVTATPAEGYEISAILVDGTAIEGNTFTVTADHTVTATFTATGPVVIASGDCGDNATYTVYDTDNDGTGDKLVISGSGDMENFNAGGQAWKDYISSIETVIINDGVTSVGNNAFANCTNITSVTLPENLTALGNNAFLGCSNLGEIDIPDSVTAIGYSAFESCTSLAEATIPDGVTSLETSLFYYCTNLSKVTIPDSVTAIGYSAFEECTSLADVYYGGTPSQWSAVSVADANSYLLNATIHYAKEDVVTYTITAGETENGTVTVDKETAQADETVTVTATPAEGYELSAILVDSTAIEGNTFTVTGNHTVTAEFTAVAPEEPELTETQTGSCGDNLTYTLTTDGVLTISGEGAVTSAPWLTYKSSIKKLVLEDGVTTVCTGAFADCVNMESVTFSKSFYIMEENAFLNCTSLSALYYTSLTTDIMNTQFEFAETGNDSFLSLSPTPTIAVTGGQYSDTVLWDITKDGSLIINGTGVVDYPEAVYDDNNNVIGAVTPWQDYAEQITKIIVNDGITSVGSNVFAGLYNATEFTFPATVEYIAENAFANTGIKKVYYTGTEIDEYFGVDTIGNEIIYNADFEYTDKSLVLSGACGENMTWTFTAADGKLTISGTGDMYGFNDPYIGPCSLEDDDNEVPWWNIRMFIKKIVVEEGVESIGKSAFLSAWDEGVLAYGTQSVSLPSTLVAIDEKAFKGQTTLTEIDIPDSVQYMGSEALSYCTSLTEVELPASLEEIPDNLFWACTSLEAVFVDTNVTVIGTGVFDECNMMSTVFYNGTEEQWNLIENSESNITEGRVDVRFVDDPDTYKITVVQPENGKIYVSKTYVDIGDRVYIEYECPDDYYLLLYVDGIPSIGNLIVTGDHTVTGEVYKVADTNVLASGDCGDDVTWVINNYGALIISGPGNMYDFKAPDDTGEGYDIPWAQYKDLFNRVFMYDYYGTNIGANAFYGCDNIYMADISASVTSIGENAFYGCDNLKVIGAVCSPAQYDEIEVAQGNEIFEDADVLFYNYENWGYCGDIIVWTLTLDGKLYIDAAWGGGPMYDYEEPVENNYIAEWFYLGTDVTEIHIDKGVTHVGDYSFYGMDKLTTVYLPTTVEAFGANAFYGCDALTDIYYEGTKEQFVSIETFEGNDSLGNVIVHCTDGDYIPCIASGKAGENLDWVLGYDGTLTISGTGAMYDFVRPDVEFNSETTESIDVPWWPYAAQVKKIVVEEGVTTVGANAFFNAPHYYWYYSNIEEIILPSTVTSIGDCSFYAQETLTSIDIPSGVTYIGEAAFLGCASVEEITIPAGVTEILGSSFAGLGITEITIPEGVTYIGSEAFEGCSNLQAIYVPVSVQNLDQCAFGYSYSGDIYYAGRQIQWNSIEKNEEDFQNAAIHYALSNIIVGDCGYKGTISLSNDWVDEGETVTVTVTAVMSEGYEDYRIKTVYVDGVAIEGTTFEATGPCTVTAEFESIYVMSGTLTNGFWGLDENGTLFIEGANIQPITSAWQGYESQIKAIVFEEGVTEIPSTLFNESPELTTITIPATVTVIGSFTFENCPKLTTVIFNAVEPEIQYAAFRGNTISDIYYASHQCAWENLLETKVAECNETLAGADVHFASYAITVDTTAEGSENGQTTVSHSEVSADETTVVTVTAVPDEGYELDRIYVNGTAIEGNTFIPTECSTVSASYVPINKTITVEQAENGTVTVDKSAAEKGETVTITATPDEHYKLVSILVDGVAIEGNTFTVTGNHVVSATFVPVEYTITVEDAENGTITVDKLTTTAGETVTVTATPNTHYQFVSILVDGVAIEGNTFTVTGNHLVSAQFEDVIYNITVIDAENGTVTVDKLTATAGETVTITATPDEHYKLSTIDVFGDNGAVLEGNTFVVTGNHTVTATFVPVEYTITVEDAENGTVTVDKITATYGETVTVTATPNTHYQLVSILVDGVAISGNTFTVTGNHTVTATFVPVEYTITVEEPENGTVTVDKLTATYNETVTVTATANDGYELVSILVDGVAIEGNTFTVTGNHTVTAIFTAVEYTITVDAGSVDYVVLSKTKAKYGETVTVTVTPPEGWELFALYANDEVVTGNQFTVKGDTVIEPKFSQIEYTISVQDVPSAMGTLSVDKTTTTYGETVTVTATPNTHYQLVSILVDGVAIEGNTFTVTGNHLVSAQFEDVIYNITVIDAENGTVTVDKLTATAGETVTITATPDEHYKLSTIDVFGDNGAVLEGNTFVVTGNHTVTATFAPVEYIITVEEPENGTVTINKTTATVGETVTVTETPDEHYKFVSILVDGVAIEGNTFVVTGNHTVTAIFAPIEYTITISDDVIDGSVIVDKETAIFSETVTVTITEPSDCKLDYITVDGVAIEGNTFTVTGNHVVSAVFIPVEYTISVQDVASAMGTLSVDKTTAVYGETVTVTATPNTHYQFVSILVDGVAIEGNTFTVTGNHLVSAQFEDVIYNITVIDAENGTVTVDKLTATAGETVTITATPDEHYKLSTIDVFGDNGAVLEGNTFVVTGNHTVTATFAPVEYTITVEEAENGTVTVDKLTATYGETVTVTATANDSYEIVSVLVDGVAIEGNTFTVTGNHVVTATFVKTAVAPQAPELFVGLSEGKPQLSWQAVEGAVKYQIYRSTTGEDGSFARIYTTSAEMYKDASAKAGTEYYYAICAVSADSLVSEMSDIVSVITTPEAPELTLTLNANGKPKLSWTKVTGAVKYEMQRSLTGEEGSYSYLATTTNLTATNTKAVAGTEYYYKVRAVAADGTYGEFSDTVSIIATPTAPEVTITLNVNGKPKLSWTKVTGAVKYEMQRSLTGEEGSYSYLASTTGLTATNTKAVAGTEYYYKVRAVAADGSYGSFSDAVSATATPEAPELTLTLNASGKPKLSWNAVNGAVKYQIYRSETGGEGSYSYLATTVNLTATNTKAVAGTEYYYIVRAIAADGTYGEFSDAVSITAKPDAPTVTVALNSNGKPKLSWDKVNGATKYQIYRSETGEEDSYSYLAATTKLTATNTKAVAGTKYYYKVRAVAADGTYGEFSDAVSIIATPTAAEVTITLNANGKPKLSWTKVTGAVKYEIQRSLTGEEGSYSYLASTTGLTATNTKAVAGTEYYYIVRAIAADGSYGEFSDAVSITAKPDAPTVTVELNSNGKPKLSWDKVNGATKYQIYRSETGEEGSYSYLASTTGLTATNTKAVAGTEYYYKVRVVTADGSYSEFSDAVSIIARPEAPMVTVELNASGKPKLSWNAVNGAVKYQIYRSETGEEDSYSYLAATTKLTATNTKAVAGTKYYYKVRAVAADGSYGKFSDNGIITSE